MYRQDTAISAGLRHPTIVTGWTRRRAGIVLSAMLLCRADASWAKSGPQPPFGKELVPGWPGPGGCGCLKAVEPGGFSDVAGRRPPAPAGARRGLPRWCSDGAAIRTAPGRFFTRRNKGRQDILLRTGRQPDRQRYLPDADCRGFGGQSGVQCGERRRNALSLPAGLSSG